MFDGKRYATKGITETIPEYLQNLLWYMIEIMDVPQKDHLQLFKLKEINDNGKVRQKITHIQEQPAYRKEHIITVKGAVNAKVYVIDDGDHSTMLLPEEY